MADNETLIIDLKSALNKLNRIIESLEIEVPSVRIECLSAKGSGSLKLVLAGWGSSQWVEKDIGTLAPGQSMTVKLNPIVEGTDNKTGETLLLRPAGEEVPLYKATNLEDYTAYMHTVTPPKYPWWQGTKIVKWGPDQPYLLLPNKDAYGYLLENWQDVYYYRTLG